MLAILGSPYPLWENCGPILSLRKTIGLVFRVVKIAGCISVSKPFLSRGKTDAWRSPKQSCHLPHSLWKLPVVSPLWEIVDLVSERKSLPAVLLRGREVGRSEQCKTQNAWVWVCSLLITSKPSPPLICQDHQSRGGGGIEMRHLNQRDGCEVMVQRWPVPAMTLNGLKEVVFLEVYVCVHVTIIKKKRGKIIGWKQTEFIFWLCSCQPQGHLYWLINSWERGFQTYKCWMSSHHAVHRSSRGSF